MTTATIKWNEKEIAGISRQIPIIKEVYKEDQKELDYQISQQAMWVYIEAFETKLYKSFHDCFNGPDLLKARRIWKKKEKQYLPLILQAFEDYTSK